jgi:methanogenesis multiheme c-type cytochrome
VKRRTDWLPDHKWYSSEDVEGHLPILGPTEHKDYQGAKIYAFNNVTTTWFVTGETDLDGSIVLDDSIIVVDVKAADDDGDNDNVTTEDEMQAYDSDGNGADYPDATLVTEDMNFQISHSVTAKEDAFTCSDCHGNNGWVLDWTRLGYDADPRHKGNIIGKKR